MLNPMLHIDLYSLVNLMTYQGIGDAKINLHIHLLILIPVLDATLGERFRKIGSVSSKTNKDNQGDRN